MTTYFSTDDCKELFAEKIAEKVLTKFKGDSFQMYLTDVTKSSLKNIAMMLRCTDVTIEFLADTYTTTFRVNSYEYNSHHKIVFMNSGYGDVGRIETTQNYDDSISTTFVSASCESIKPLYKEIVLQLLSM